MKIRSLFLPSDAALVRRALRDRPEAFEALVLRHEMRVRTVLLAMRIPSQEAPDLIQQTFLQAFRSLSGLGPAGPGRLHQAPGERRLPSGRGRRDHRPRRLLANPAPPTGPLPDQRASGTRSVQETVHWTLGGERITLLLPD